MADTLPGALPGRAYAFAPPLNVEPEPGSNDNYPFIELKSIVLPFDLEITDFLM
jgi:hypothetical protein